MPASEYRKRANVREAPILHAVLDYLAVCPDVALAWRQNQGGMEIEDRYVRFAHVDGISDVIGFLRDGRFLAIECKRAKGGVVSSEQRSFLAAVHDANAVAIVARSVDDVMRGISEAMRPSGKQLAMNHLG